MRTILAGLALMTGTLCAGETVLSAPGTVPSYGYAYGGRTKAEMSAKTGEIAIHADDKQWSGWTFGLPAQDLRAIRRTGALQFEVKGAAGGERFHIGLLDGSNPDHKVQTRVDGWGYGDVRKEWTPMTIPLSDFPGQGWWWDEKLHQERPADFDWAKVVEFRLSTDQDGNRNARDAQQMAHLVLRNLRLVPDAPGHFDAKAFWEAFRSDAPDLALPFDAPKARWPLRKGQIASLDSAWLPAGGPEGQRALELRFRFQDWVSAELDLASLGSPSQDWSRHAAVGLSIFCPRTAASLRIALHDSTDESWSATTSLKPGWNRVALPLASFVRDAYWQPENAGRDRRLDLGGMKTLSLQPMDGALPTTLKVAGIFLTNSVKLPGPAAVAGTKVLHNQIGYLPAFGKRFLVSNPGAQTEWALLDEKGKTVVFGKLAPLGRWELSGDTMAMGDFSRWTKAGTYRLSVGDTVSEPFRIGAGIYRTTLLKAIRSYWFQRASLALPESLAGQWARPAGHPDLALPVREVPGAVGTRDVPGGWYDAGDYGKYVVNAGYSLGLLMDRYARTPSLVKDGELRIPESGNGRSDLLDEIRWELDWILRMQDKDGGFFFKVATLKWDGMVMPHEATGPRHVIGKSTTSTLNGTAVLAQASRTFAATDPEFAKICLAKARHGWEWATKHPAVEAPSETGGSGGYGDQEFRDEFLWAAVQLWLATGEARFQAKVQELSPALPPIPASHWRDVRNLAWMELACPAAKGTLADTARRLLCEQADSILATLEGSAGRVPSESFPWGSNDFFLNHAVVLAVAYGIRPEERWRDAALEILDHVLGRNVQDTCFVTGCGARSPMRPHHRILQGDTVDAPFPGLLVGGPNAGRQDNATSTPGGVTYGSTLPARSWLDDWRSYASNETAINWNATLVWMLGWALELEAPPR